MSLGSRVPYTSSSSPPSPASKAWATPVPAGRATTWPVRSAISLVTQPERPLAADHDEQLLLGRVTVRRAVELARRHQLVEQAGGHRAGGAAQLALCGGDGAALQRLDLDVGPVHDVRRPRRGRRELGRADGHRRLPRVGAAGGHPARPQPADVGRGQHAQLHRRALAEHQHLEAVGASPAACVRRGWRRARCSLPARSRTSRRPATRAPNPTEHVEDLLLGRRGDGAEWGFAPGSIRSRFMPTVTLPAAAPSRVHSALRGSPSPAAAGDTSSQWATGAPLIAARPAPARWQSPSRSGSGQASWRRPRAGSPPSRAPRSCAGASWTPRR